MDATGTGSGWEATSGGELKAVYIDVDPCGGNTTIIDSRDSKTYAIVRIGGQCWMKQNINIGTRINGSSNQGTSCTSIQKYCYSDTDANCNTTNHPNYPDGGLYQWDQAMCGSRTEGAKGICPTGWHIPTDAQQYILENYLKDTGQTCNATRNGPDCATAGTKLQPNGTSGFEGNFTGWRNTNGAFQYRNSSAFFRSSLENDSTDAWNRQLNANSPTMVLRSSYPKGIGLSVRCLKD